MKGKFFTSTFAILLLALCLLSGCKAGPNPAIDIHTPIAEYTPVKSPSPYYTEMELSMEPSALPTEDVQPIPGCINSSFIEISWNAISSGTILMENTADIGYYFLYDLQVDAEYQLPIQVEDMLWDLEISPDNNHLAYAQYTDFDGTRHNTLYVWTINAHADILSKIVLDRNDIGRIHWLNNDRLSLYTEITYQDGTVLLINPFTSEQQLLQNDMANLYTGPLAGRLPWLVKYSPNADWGMYVESETGFSPDKAVLRDFVLGQTLWESVQPPGRFYNVPRWSPDGTQLAYSDGIELYLINRSGDALLLAKMALDDFYRWSPDGRYLAFAKAKTLTLYDTWDQEIIDLCIPLNPKSSGSLPTLLWSPDSTQIYLDEESAFYNMIIDISNNTVYKIAPIENGIPAGWMNSNP